LAVEPANTLIDDASRQWRAFAAIFVTVFVGGLALIYGFIVLMDPYGINPYSLPIRRAIVSISQRYMYPQLIRSHHFDSFVVGTSTSRLLDPRILNQMFHARFVNLGMDSMTAWEQSTVMDYFVRQVGAPKVVLVGLDGVWCDADAVRHRITSRGFPSWLYEDTPARAFAYLLNYGTFEIAGRLVGYQLGLYPERVRNDGFEVFVPPDDTYDPERARRNIGHRPAPVDRSESAPPQFSFPALPWLDAALAKMPNSIKILTYMPVHVAAQPAPGTRQEQAEIECKRQIAAIAENRHAIVVDWRIASSITEDDGNYWDALHYRLPLAQRIARQTAQAVLNGAPSEDGAYQIVVRAAGDVP
jgi:hypothetical protein